MEFVTLREKRLCLESSGTPWLFAGANCYYLMVRNDILGGNTAATPLSYKNGSSSNHCFSMHDTRCLIVSHLCLLVSLFGHIQTRAADPGTYSDVERVLDDIASAGFTVVRSWCFCDGPRWNALQPRPGHYDDRVFVALDRVIYEASRRGLRLLFAFTDYWDAYGGMPQYMRWSRDVGGTQDQQITADYFYEDAWCQAVFENFVSTVINRVNTISGIPYRDEPAILGWAPANEPRCAADPGGRRGVVSKWMHRCSGFIKSLDARHLVFADCEGWLGTSTPQHCCANPYDCRDTGCDFAADCSSPHIDVACFHMYPDSWMQNVNDGTDAKTRFAVHWIETHIDIAREKLGKPLVLSEFGKKAGAPGEREAWLQTVLDACVWSMAQQAGGLVGVLYWMVAAPSYPGKAVYVLATTILDP
jgi:mannan endo-1,4-beta-mannosidase